MKLKFLSIFGVLLISAVPMMGAHAAQFDVADPLYLEKSGDFVSRSNISYTDDILRLSQKFSYGINDKLSIGADLKYQQDFNGREDGFSNIGLHGMYRLSEGPTIADALIGISFGGSKRVREPDFADTVYSAGVRFGRVWNRFTLAGTVKTSWVFDENRGMAYINLIPEAYVRITDKWMTGIGFDFQKSTNPNFDREWINFKLVRQYGRTQYVAHVDYEFENENWMGGLKINIVF